MNPTIASAKIGLLAWPAARLAAGVFDAATTPVLELPLPVTVVSRAVLILATDVLNELSVETLESTVAVSFAKSSLDVVVVIAATAAVEAAAAGLSVELSAGAIL